MGQGTSIIVNGRSVIGLTDEAARTVTGALALETGTFRSVFEPPLAAAFKQDGTGTYALTKRSGNGGYTNHPQTNQMSPITGKVLVVKTNDGGLCKNRNCKLLQRE